LIAQFIKTLRRNHTVKRSFSLLALLVIFCAGQTKFVRAQSMNFGEVDAQAWQFLSTSDRAAGTQLTLLALGLDPALLDEKPIMKCYISMFNHTPPQNYMRIHQDLNNELAYPDMVAFYKPRIPKILAIVPRTIQLGTSVAEISVAGRPPYSSNIELGEYDTTRKAFPFVDGAGKPASITYTDMGVFDSANCDSATGLEIVVLFDKAVTFSELPMDQDTAKAYLSTPGIGPAGRGRQVRLGFDLRVLDEVPKISPHPTNSTLRQVFLKTRVTRITALGMLPNKTPRPIGIVYYGSN
jgi:hypothetical protein